MSVCAQAKAARRKARQDLRWHVRTADGTYHARHAKSGGAYLNVSQRKAASRNRKRVQAGGHAGSIGFKK